MRKQIQTAVIAISTFAFLGGCSLMDARSSGARRPEVRDVPFQARNKNELNPRKRVMVLPFLDNGASARTDQGALSARDGFVRALKRTDEFVVVANSDFPKDVTTFLKNGEYDLESMAKLGAAMGVSAIIEGRILQIKARRVGDEVGLVRQVKAKIDANVSLRMISTQNGHVLMNETKQASVEESVTRLGERAFSDRFLEEDPKLIESVVAEAFRTTIPKIVQNLDKLSWEGRVALVKGDRVYLNAGRISGIQIGDILKITEDGEDVYDPDTGALIGKVPGRLKGTVEIVSYFGKDGSVSIVHSGSGFRENDHVELY
jgi:TolB-like protein